MASICVCPPPTPLPKMVRLSVSFVPLTMSFAHFCSRLLLPPPSFWVEALHTTTHLLNFLPTKTLQPSTPHFALFGTLPQYDHMRVFGCICYPNLSTTASHMIAPHSTMCVFLGYSAQHKGYQCLDLTSNKVIISRHIARPHPSLRRILSFWITLIMCRPPLDQHNPLCLQVPLFVVSARARGSQHATPTDGLRCAGSSPLLTEQSPLGDLHCAGSSPLLAERSLPGASTSLDTTQPRAAVSPPSPST